MRALLISLLVVSAAPVLAQETPTAAPLPPPPPPIAPANYPPITPLQTPPPAPVVAAPPAPDTAVSADQAIDPLADLISQSGPQTTDEEETAPQAAPPVHKPTILPIPAPDADELPGNAIPQGGYVPAAVAYDLRVKSSILAAQGLQGPFDGGWSVDGPDGETLYRLQVVDKVGGNDPLEGAWRDVRRTGTVGSTGLIDFIERSYGGFIVRFAPRPGQLATLGLTARGDGSWTGKLNENGVETLVTARRVPQATLPPGYTPTPFPRPVAAPRVAAAPAKAPACSTKGKTGKALKAAKAKCAAAAKKSGKGKATAAKGKKGGKGKATASSGKKKGSAAATKSMSKKKKKS